MIIFGTWWWGSAGGGVCVCIEGVRVCEGGRLDKVLPCSDTCLRFQGFCSMQDQTDAI